MVLLEFQPQRSGDRRQIFTTGNGMWPEESDLSLHDLNGHGYVLLGSLNASEEPAKKVPPQGTTAARSNPPAAREAFREAAGSRPDNHWHGSHPTGLPGV